MSADVRIAIDILGARHNRHRSSSGDARPVFIEEHVNAIRALCERHGIRRLDLSGSALNARFDEETSDLDFVVDFADRSSAYADRHLAVADGLKALFGRHVDLMTERSIQSSSFRRSVDANRKTIYKSKRQPVGCVAS